MTKTLRLSVVTLAFCLPSVGRLVRDRRGVREMPFR
jgi:hypothetical protein